MQELLAIVGFLFLALLAVLALVACSGSGASDESTPERPEADEPARRRGAPLRGRYRVIDVQQGGSVSGTVRWVGPRAELAALPVRIHRRLCGESQPPPVLSVDARGGVANLVVSLDDMRAGGAIEQPDPMPTLDRRACRFVPHVMAVARGTRVRFLNSDPVLHNVRARFGRRTWLNLGLPRRNSEATRRVPQAGACRIVNDSGDSWMHAWLHVFEHPYFAVSTEHGRFRIDHVPEGEYTLRAWHEGFLVSGTRSGRPVYSNPIVLSRPVSIAARQATTADFELSLRAAEAAGGRATQH